MWWHVSVFIALGSWRQEDGEFRFLLGYIWSLKTVKGEKWGYWETREIVDDK